MAHGLHRDLRRFRYNYCLHAGYGPSDLMATTWDEFLTDYEAKIASTEAALENGTDLDPAVLKPFEAPQDLGPIPEIYVERTVEMLRKSAEISQRLENAMGAIQQDLGKAARSGAARPKSPFSDSSTPQYFDNAI